VFTLPDDLKGVYQGFGLDLPRNTGHPAWELPMPARFVIDRRGIIRAADVDPDYTVRPEPEATLAIVRSLA
jgi:peroxiredoxin